MARIVASFTVGVVVTSIAFLWWGGPPDDGAVRDQGVATETQSSITELVDAELHPDVDTAGSITVDADDQDQIRASAATQPAATDPSAVRDFETREGAVLARSAATMRITPEELERILAHSHHVRSATPNRYSSFDDQARTHDPTSTFLEGILVNAAWHAAPTTSSPVSIDTECRASACRVRFAFATDEGLLAAAQSTMDLSLLVALKEHGFEAVDARINPDDRNQTMDVYLWRESGTTP